ncbi:MAG: ABC transporter permease [Candidatus Omnitrophica bacterium]|nr:ABC transporter permease [Candidatus Omnitrophota bacterium]
MFNQILARKDLIAQLVVRDLKIKYLRPVLGSFWAFLSPLSMVLIFYLVFYRILKINITEAPFMLYLMSGIFTWNFFQESISSSTVSLVNSRNLIKEANFPHYLIPISIVLTNAINFLPTLAVLIITSLIVLKGLPLFIIFLPFVVLIHLAITTGFAIICSILYVKWRDIKYVLDVVLLLMLYLTPAFYSIMQVKGVFPRWLFMLYAHNPFVGILNMYRVTLLKGFWGFVHKDIGLMAFIGLPVIFAVLILYLSYKFYQRQKAGINDYLSY